MGVVAKTFYDELCDPVPARNCNRIRVYQMPNKEVVIHYRDMKIVLHTREEIEEWKNGFATALRNLGDSFENDL